MIILDDDGGQTKSDADAYRGLTLRHPQAAFTISSSPLPDYDTSEAQYWKPTPQPKTSLIDPRIWKGAFYALFLYIFFSLIIVTPIVVMNNRRQSHSSSNYWQIGPSNSLWTTDNDDLLAPFHLSGAISFSDNQICNVWEATSSENIVKSQFALPPSGLISIRSNITYNTMSPSQISGNLSINENLDVQEKNVNVNVELLSSSNQIRHRTNVCFSLTGSNRGLSIYVPDNLQDTDQMNFKINILLPQVKSTVDNLLTYLPMITQEIGDLPPHLRFSQFYLEGAIRPITCKLLQAPQISVKNVAASIEGAYNVSYALTLDSVKGSIISNITLISSSGRPSFLTISTGDSPINANITLNSPTLTLTSTPSFFVKVTNFNAPLNLTLSYGKHSSAAPLQLEVRNNLAESRVSLDSEYQGYFSAQTKMSQVELNDYVLISSSTAAKKRILTYDQNSQNIVSGWIGRDAKPMSQSQRTIQSSVDIVSALSPVELEFV